MAIVQCANKHYYDDSKHQECPHCKNMDQNIQERHTVALSKSKEMDTAGVTQSLRSQVEDSQKTISVYASTNANTNPVAGWLVCIEGETRGKSYDVHVGKNFAGRSMKMDIHMNDEQISRENHYTIIFEPKAIKFYISPGNGITYYNGEMLQEAKELQEGDEIAAGGSKFVFVPFCKEGRGW